MYIHIYISRYLPRYQVRQGVIWLDTQSHFHLIVGSHITDKLSVEGADEALLNFLGRLGSDGHCLTLCVDKPQAFGVAHRKMTLRQGDLVLYDSRTMHCGGSFSATAPIPAVWFLVCWIQAARTKTRTVRTRTKMRTPRPLRTWRTGTRTITIEKTTIPTTIPTTKAGGGC